MYDDIFRISPTLSVVYNWVRLCVLKIGVNQWTAHQRRHVIVYLAGHREGERKLDRVSPFPFPLNYKKLTGLY